MKKTFALLIAAFVIVSSPTFAGASEISPLRTPEWISFDGAFVEAKYTVSGGCEDHAGTVLIDYSSATDTYYINLYDTTEVPDRCKSFVSVTMKVDIRDQISQMILAGGRTPGTSVKVVLPTVLMSTK